MTRYIVFCRALTPTHITPWLYYGDYDRERDASEACHTIQFRSGGTPRETIIKEVELPE